MAKVIYSVVLSEFNVFNQKTDIDIITSCGELGMAKEELQDELLNRYRGEFEDDERTFEENERRYNSFISDHLSDDGMIFTDRFNNWHTRYEVIENILVD